MSKCPACGDEAYLGLKVVECSNLFCSFYKTGNNIVRGCKVRVKKGSSSSNVACKALIASLDWAAENFIGTVKGSSPCLLCTQLHVDVEGVAKRGIPCMFSFLPECLEVL